MRIRDEHRSVIDDVFLREALQLLRHHEAVESQTLINQLERAYFFRTLFAHCFGTIVFCICRFMRLSARASRFFTESASSASRRDASIFRLSIFT